jgi:hypothetical protein
MNKKQAEKEAKTLRELCLCLGRKKGHDPQNLVYEHMRVVKLAPQIVHEVNFVEDIFRGALYFEEVLEILTNEPTKEQLQKEED